MSNAGLLFTIVGPTGVGKNALMNDAIKHLPVLRQMPTATTRPRREGEQQGRERLFVSRSEFERMITEDALLEWQEVHPNRLYGVPRQALEDAFKNGLYLIADIDVLGATYIRSLYPENVILIFVQPTSVQELIKRMRTRGDDKEDIPTRLKRVAMEMAYVPVADHVVVNDNFQKAAKRFRTIVAQELAREDPTTRQFSHTVLSIPIYQDEVLYHHEAPHYPETPLRANEIPHQAALRSLRECFAINPLHENLLRIEPNKGSFISPVQIEAYDQGQTKYIRFTYVYLMAERLFLPEGWNWRPSDEVQLPDVATQILNETSR